MEKISIPCRASYYAQGRFWRIGWIHPFLSNHPGAVHPNIQNRPRQNSWCGKNLNTFFPPNKSDDLWLFFCLYPSSLCTWCLLLCTWCSPWPPSCPDHRYSAACGFSGPVHRKKEGCKEGQKQTNTGGHIEGGGGGGCVPLCFAVKSKSVLSGQTSFHNLVLLVPPPPRFSSSKADKLVPRILTFWTV